MESTPNELLILGLLLVTGLGAGLTASRFGLPRVAGYVLAGMLFSPALLGGLLGLRIGAWSEPITTLALGMIAYLIGGSITVQQLRRMGRVIIGSALGASLGAVLLVFAVLVLLVPASSSVSAFHLAIAFAVIASATDPAATVAVIQQYRAKGPVTSTLLGVAALDDALGIILFSLVVGFGGDVSLVASVTTAALEIGGGVAMGLAAGWMLTQAIRVVREDALRLVLVVGSVVLIVGLAEWAGLSSLLAAMCMGFFARHVSGAAAQRLFESTDKLEEMVFVLFFTLAGAQFLPRVFVDRLDLILAYFFARIAGKVMGSAVGARLSGAPPSVVRWLGPTLIPQAGVAVGLALVLAHQPPFRSAGPMIVNVVLGTTVLYELIGPLTSRFALARAGELAEGRPS